MFLRGDKVRHRLLNASGTVTGSVNGGIIVAWSFGKTELVHPLELQLVEHSVIL
jgi:hypothetical protein